MKTKKEATSLQRARIETDPPERSVNVTTFHDQRGYFWLQEPADYEAWLLAQAPGEVELVPPGVETRGPFASYDAVLRDQRGALFPNEPVRHVHHGDPLIVADRKQADRPQRKGLSASRAAERSRARCADQQATVSQKSNSPSIGGKFQKFLPSGREACGA
jgi:hypothetical protein